MKRHGEDMDAFCTTEILFSDKFSAEKILQSRVGKNVVLFLNESADMRWDLKKLRYSLEKQSNTFLWINSIPVNPTQNDILQVLRIIGGQCVDTLIAIGGGSTIDLAKAILIFSHPEKNLTYTLDEITSCIRNKSYSGGSCIELIAVPTTAGTGSELTQWATIWDVHKLGKYSIDHPELKPQVALIVPEFTLTLPLPITLSAGLDALCHAVEAYWSKYTTPLVQEISYRSIEIILGTLPDTIHSPTNLLYREKMCKASVLAGLAFSQTRTTACHAISYPLTQFYDIPHGIAAALTLNAVSMINRGHFPNDDELFCLFERYGGLGTWMKDTCGQHLSLGFYGIQIDDLDSLATASISNGRIDNNPVVLSKDDVYRILLSLLT